MMDTQKAIRLIQTIERYAPALDEDLLDAIEELRAESVIKQAA